MTQFSSKVSGLTKFLSIKFNDDEENVNQINVDENCNYYFIATMLWRKIHENTICQLNSCPCSMRSWFTSVQQPITLYVQYHHCVKVTRLFW